MKMILLGILSDGSNFRNADQLLTRVVYLGQGDGADDEDNRGTLDAQDRAYEELRAAQEAVDATNAYGRTLIVLEPDEE